MNNITASSALPFLAGLVLGALVGWWRRGRTMPDTLTYWTAGWNAAAHALGPKRTWQATLDELAPKVIHEGEE